MRVSVFGGSNPKPGEAAYQQAYQLGKLIGEAGFTVLTGGYMGTMEAVSRGAAEAGGHVIGITCDQIETWRPVSANRWVQEQMRFATLRERLYALIENCDAALVLPGGIGTLAETAVMWSQMQTRAIKPRPLILIGAGWQKVLDHFIEQFDTYVPEIHRQLVAFAPDATIAFQMLIKESGLTNN
jgi:uncharacterized protein (TIGR00730 family)